MIRQKPTKANRLIPVKPEKLKTVEKLKVEWNSNTYILI